jgi:lysozyme
MTDPAVAIAAPFIGKFEGFRSHPYQDIAGVWTQGYGATILEDGTPVTASTPPTTEAEALAYLAQYVGRIVSAIRTMSRPRMTANQCAAAASLAYNVGINAFRGSTLLADWNAGNIAGVEAQWLLWDMVDGHQVAALEGRRKAELALFKTPDGAEVDANPVPTPPAPEDEADALDDEFN